MDEGENSKIVTTYEEVEANLDYIHHQYVVSEVQYFSDLTDDEAYENYVDAEDAYMTLCEESLRVQKKLYNSDLPAKDKVFADWTEAELKDLSVDSKELVELEREQNELFREYLNLENPETEEWSDELEEIYLDYVKNADKIADLYGYDNYYDYAAKELYMRDYSLQQRESFRENVKEYILPLYLQVDELYEEKRDNLTREQWEELSALQNDTCSEFDELLTGYIDSYPEEMREIMNYMFGREAIVYADSEEAHTAGYTNYSYYMDQPFVFLGNACQDMLTVVHELGHYVSLYHFTDASLPYDTCEVHSQGNEWLMMQYLDGKIDQDVYDTFVLWRLKYGLDTVVLSTIVDEYEEAVYGSQSISSPEEFEDILLGVLEEYENIEDFASKEDLYTYIQYVTIESPVYYLSYATSELSAISFYTVVEEEGYEAAQDIFVALCLETPTDNLFFDTLEDVGLPNPLEMDTVNRIIDSFDLKAS